jgi:O-antigen/teichoic acid export membrane protein
MSFRKKTFHNIYQMARFTYSGEVVTFLTSIILARLLLPEEYGFVAMILVFTNFGEILSGIGIGSEIIRSNYRYTFHKSMMNLAFYIGLTLCIGMMLLAYPVALFYDNMALIAPMILLAFKFILKSLNSVYGSLVLKKQEFTFVGKMELYNILIANTLMVIMAYMGFSYWSLIVPYLFSDSYKLIRYILHTKIRLRLYPFVYTRAAFKQAKSLMGSILGVRIISYWSRNLDNLLVGKLHGEASLGVYNRGYRFLNLTDKIITNLFGSVLYPNLQKLKDINGNVFSEYLFFVGVVTLMVYPIGGLLIMFPDLLVSILWGPNWLEVAQYLPFFGLVIFSNATKSNYETLFKLYYREGLLFKFGIFNSSLNVISIIIGSYYSALMIAQLLAFSQLFIVLPIAIFYVFGKQMGFKGTTLLSFFLPRLLLLCGTWIAVVLNYHWLTIILISLYFLFMIFIQRKDLNRLIQMTTERFKK